MQVENRERIPGKNIMYRMYHQGTRREHHFLRARGVEALRPCIGSCEMGGHCTALNGERRFMRNHSVIFFGKGDFLNSLLRTTLHRLYCPLFGRVSASALGKKPLTQRPSPRDNRLHIPSDDDDAPGPC